MKLMDVMQMEDVESIALRVGEWDETIRLRFKDFQFLRLFDVVPQPERLAFAPHPDSCYYAADILNDDPHDDYYAKGGAEFCLHPFADQWRPQMGCVCSPFRRLGKWPDIQGLFIRYRKPREGARRKSKWIHLPYVSAPYPGIPEDADVDYNALAKSWQDASGAMHIEVVPETDGRLDNT